MNRIATNTLTGWAAAIVGFYIIASLVVPGLWLAVVVRIGLFFSGIAALIEWGPPAFNLLKERKGPSDSRGEILSFLGIATVSLGVVYSSLWGILWYANGMPAGWAATGHSMFGTYLTGIGLALIYRSTDIKRDVIRPVNWWVIVAAMIVVAAAGFTVGSKVGSQQSALATRLAHADCPIAVSTRGIYHTADSPYRMMVKSVRCYDDEGEAKAAGFRPLSGM